MNMTQSIFKENDPTATSPPLRQPRHSDNDNVSSKMPQNLQCTPSVSSASYGAGYGSFRAVTTPATNSYEPSIQQSPRIFQPFTTSSGTEQLSRFDINASEWDSTPGAPTTIRYGAYSYPPPVPEHENDAFFGFNNTVAQQQQPYIWSQQDFTLRSTLTVSPQDLRVQSYPDYFESPSSTSTESQNTPANDEYLPSSSPICTTPTPGDPVPMPISKPKKGSRPTHNMVEKQYRMRLNAHFDELLAKIPKEYLQSGSDLGIEGKNTSKTETLVMAEHYIKTLERDENKLSMENKELLYHLETLKAEWKRNGGVLLP